MNAVIFIKRIYVLLNYYSGLRYCASQWLFLQTGVQKHFIISFLFIAGLLACFSSSAQLCTGSLGLPIVNKTFGSGSNPGAPLLAASTNYQYVSTDCPNDGFYTVRNNTAGCFGNSWHNLGSDHTGDPGGYFMLVNASVQPGAFYLDTVTGLCSGTTFEFAAWIANVLRGSACGGAGITPNLTFSIEKTDGTVIQTYNTGSIPTPAAPVWQQYGFFFTTPVGVSTVVLRIVNNAPGGCGNDLALDDITFRPCGPLLDPSITGYTTDTATICEGVSAAFDFSCTVSSGFSNPLFQWQESINNGPFTDIPGATSVNYTKNIVSSTPGIRQYRMLAAEAGNINNTGCRVISTLISIYTEAIPVIATSGNLQVCEGNTIQLNASGAAQYLWTGPNSFSANTGTASIPNAQFIHSGKYYITASSPAGCLKNDSATVTVNPVPAATVSFGAATICEGDVLQMNASGGGSYQWTPATGLSSATIPDPSMSPVVTTQYQLVVTNNFNCTDTATVNIDVIKKPVANAGPDKETVLGLPVTLNGNAGGDNISYNWTPSLYLDNTSLLQPAALPLAAGQYNYKLTVTSGSGCGSAEDDVTVLVYKGIYIPTAFTPNQDGKNDSWYIPSLAAFPVFELSVFNRYGQVVFYTKNIQGGWDGKYKGLPQPTGVFVYLLTIGEAENKKMYKGTVTLIR
jgi:gliding motility-associated-like protein